MKTLFATSLFIAIVATPTWASFEKGNGGDVYVCRNNLGKITSINLLDFEEYNTSPGLELDTSLDGGSYRDIYRRVTDRLKKIAPALAARYEKQFKNFKPEVKGSEAVLVDKELLDIPDSMESFKASPGCAIEQLAIQFVPSTPYEARYQINQSLWEALAPYPMLQAALVSHEIIYTEGIQFNHPDSRYVRLMNRMLFSEKMNTMSWGDFGMLRAATAFLQYDLPANFINDKNLLFSLESINPNTFAVFNVGTVSYKAENFKQTVLVSEPVVSILEPNWRYLNVNQLMSLVGIQFKKQKDGTYTMITPMSIEKDQILEDISGRFNIKTMTDRGILCPGGESPQTIFTKSGWVESEGEIVNLDLKEKSKSFYKIDFDCATGEVRHLSKWK